MKILVVDDHALTRDGLRGVLEGLRGDAEIAEAAEACEAIRYIDACPDTDLVLLDLLLPSGSGLDVLAELRACHPAVSVVVLSACVERNTIVQALELGALGFIPKSASREVLRGALELVFGGGVYVPPEALDRESHASTLPCLARASLATLGLTERQGEVLELMMRGRSNKAICRELGIAEPTVKNHVSGILRALGVDNRTEAVIAASARLPIR